MHICFIFNLRKCLLLSVLSLLVLGGCNEEDGPKKLESEVDLLNPNDVKIFMGHFGDDGQSRLEFWKKVENKEAVFKGKISKINTYDYTLSYPNSGVDCKFANLYKHHLLKQNKGDEFECTGVYEDYKTYVGDKVRVTVKYVPSEEAKLKYDAPPEITKFTDIDAHSLSLKMSKMTQLLRKDFWEAEVAEKEMYVEGIVGEVSSPNLLLDARVVYYNKNVICAVGARDEYLIRNLKKGDSFLCAGKTGSNYVHLEGKSVFTIYFDPEMGLK